MTQTASLLASQMFRQTFSVTFTACFCVKVYALSRCQQTFLGDVHRVPVPAGIRLAWRGGFFDMR